MSNAENGRVMLSLKGFLRLKAIFECTLDELVEPDGGSKRAEAKVQDKKYRIVLCDD